MKARRGTRYLSARRQLVSAQRAVHLDVEIDVARCVDQVDLCAFPERSGGRAVDGDAACALLRVEVHGGVTLVHLADAVVRAGVEQDAFGGGGLAGVDVGNDAAVSEFSGGVHANLSLNAWGQPSSGVRRQAGAKALAATGQSTSASRLVLWREESWRSACRRCAWCVGEKHKPRRVRACRGCVAGKPKRPSEGCSESRVYAVNVACLP